VVVVELEASGQHQANDAVVSFFENQRRREKVYCPKRKTCEWPDQEGGDLRLKLPHEGRRVEEDGGDREGRHETKTV
jgi:hypothetical protein